MLARDFERLIQTKNLFGHRKSKGASRFAKFLFCGFSIYSTGMEKEVYILEDDQSICELVKCSLEMNGMSCKVYHTVKDFTAAAEKYPPEVALLDIMLPDGSGLEVLKKLKSTYGDCYCIMLSALGSELDKVKGLNAGADDYISKPFGVLELMARINVAFRKKKNSLVRGALELDEESMTVTLNGETLELNNKEFQLLKYCMEHEGKVLTREKLLVSIWGYDVGETRTVDNHIARLRKLGIDYFETVFGVGYKFIIKEKKPDCQGV